MDPFLPYINNAGPFHGIRSFPTTELLVRPSNLLWASLLKLHPSSIFFLFTRSLLVATRSDGGFFQRLQ